MPARTAPAAVADLTFHPDAPVTLADRQGAFTSSFNCRQGQLKFTLLAWVRDRHNADNTYCPECGEIAPKTHWRATLPERQDMADNGAAPRS